MKWRIDFDKGKYYIIEADFHAEDNRSDRSYIVHFYKRVETNTESRASILIGTYVNPRAFYPLKTKE